jgi:hypothetical protein
MNNDLLNIDIQETVIVEGRVGTPWVLHYQGCFSEYGPGRYDTTYIFKDSGHLKLNKEDTYIKDRYAGNTWLIHFSSDEIMEAQENSNMGISSLDILMRKCEKWNNYTVIHRDVLDIIFKLKDKK